jgi:hypothetical protein
MVASKDLFPKVLSFFSKGEAFFAKVLGGVMI